jgi:hypothetical protein
MHIVNQINNSMFAMKQCRGTSTQTKDILISVPFINLLVVKT